MIWWRSLRSACLGLACLGLVLPGGLAPGAQPSAGTPRTADKACETPPIGDVELESNGTLRGMVVNLQGVPLGKASIVVRQADRELGRTSTDGQGRFSLDGLRGGTYHVAAGRWAKMFRVWGPNTAPPRAKQVALLVVGEDVVRAQMTLEEFWTCEPIVITAMLGAMIAIPIAVYNNGPASP